MMFELWWIREPGSCDQIDAIQVSKYSMEEREMEKSQGVVIEALSAPGGKACPDGAWPHRGATLMAPDSGNRFRQSLRGTK